MDEFKKKIEPEELLAHQIEQFKLLHAEAAKLNTKLVVVIVILLASLLLVLLPILFTMFTPVFNLVNVVK